MGAERWIVFLVLASLGGGIYIMSYLVDEESMEKYGKRVADYNAQHHETMMDAALHRVKRRFPGSDISAENKQPVVSKVDTGSEPVDDDGIGRPFSENDRVMRARVKEVEDPDYETAMQSTVEDLKAVNRDQEIVRAGVHVGEDPDSERAKRSNMEDAKPENPDQEIVRARWPSQKDINGVDQQTGTAKSSRGQVTNEDPHLPHQETARAKRSGGQGMNEERPDHPYPEAARARRSSGQGISEEDPEHPYQDTARARSSSEQGMNEEHPDHPYQETARAKKSSGQGMNEENPDHPYQETARAKRSSGQGMNEEIPDHPYHGPARVRAASRQGIIEEDPQHPYHVTGGARISSGQGISKELSLLGSNIDHEYQFTPSLNADLFESSEGNDAQEEQMLLTNKLLTTHDADVSWNEMGNSEHLWRLDQSSEESDYSEPEESHINPYQTYEVADSGKPDDHLTHISRHLLDSDGDKKLMTFNKGIDFILKLMNAMFSLEGENSVPLPGLNKTFGHGIMKGTFEASQGFFKNPATLHRTGDVAIVKNGDTVALEVALGLETLEAGYGHYDLKILKIHQNGTLDASVAENSIKMKISLTYYPHCKVDVKYLELDKLGGIKIDITGLGAFQSMFDMLSKWLLDNFTNDFRNTVNKKLIEKAKKAVAREDICKYFPVNLL